MTDRPSAYLDPIVRTAVNMLTADGARILPISPVLAERIVRQFAHDSYMAGRHEAIRELRTRAQVAAELGISPGRVSQLAESRQLGWEVAPHTKLFRPEDVDAMRERRPGRPAKTDDAR